MQAVLLAAVLAGCAPPHDWAAPPATASTQRAGPLLAPPPADEPMLALPDLMALVVDPAAGVFGPAFQRDPQREPQAPQAWQAVADAASELERTAAVLEQPGWSLGRAEWLRAVAELRDGTRAGAEAARRRDARQLAGAAQRLQVACDGCHAHYAPALR
jgi:hypothetical protein